MIRDSVYDLVTDDIFLRFSDVLPGSELYLKIEGLNPAGSVKLKPAVELIEDAERRGLLSPGGCVVESSSGNLGVALATVCAAKGYAFTCVTDVNAAPHNVALMRALGARVAVVDQQDANGGFLGTRIAHIQHMLANDPLLVWPNQYANPANAKAHERRTAASILAEIPTVDFLFVGAGSTGTLTGCATYFREVSPRTRIFAVDTLGSVTFGTAAGPRHIPGLGTSRTPEICRPDLVDEVVLVQETDAVRTCRLLALRHGLLVGGSTGSVFTAVQRAAPDIPPGSRVVALAPDMGERYLSSVYDDDWVAARFGIDPTHVFEALTHPQHPEKESPCSHSM
ncbi:2,3-diaminopropionate biosynthesis protein SbnA [Streptomyces lasiicapitis]|uniref:2,3-diaminopropionate biosynthesis protein SbnA n=1 Tax=Streptomyces lasiicapitis TaxID=1923961 RepID=A0ABQ2MR54_9ACTN|nr:2,3-diaminopropionate biosynthesis protein SbnA [Streptomyces lasiicapitis]